MKKRALSLLMSLVMLVSMLPTTAWAADEETTTPEETTESVDFVATLEGSETPLTYTTVKGGYSYTAYGSDAPTIVDLYKVQIPVGTTMVNLGYKTGHFTYNYRATGTNPAVAGDYLCGAISDDKYHTGEESKSVPVDYTPDNGESDGLIDYIQVQTPFDENFNSDVLYAITFEYAAPFTATYDGSPLNVTALAADGYAHYSGNGPLYTVTVPKSAKSVELSFPENYILYNYDGNGNWLYSYSNVGDYVGVTNINGVKLDSNDDQVLDYVQVQQPYTVSEGDDGKPQYGGGEFICAIKFVYPNGTDGSTEPTEGVSASDVMHNIAAKYAKSGVAQDSYSYWFAADMMAYEKTFPDSANKLTQAQKQAMMEVAVQTLEKSKVPGDLAKSIVALTAMGYDATKITTASGETLNGVDKLVDVLSDETNLGSFFTYTVPYVIIAFQQYSDAYQAQLDKWIAYTLKQKDSWMSTSWGTDGITPIILALAPYVETNADVKTALNAAVAAMPECQKEDGSMGSPTYPGNAASTGLAIAAVSALGIDPATFVNATSGKSLIDGLMASVLESEDGFTSASDTLNTEQGFRGLIAMANVQATGKSYRLFDFRGQTLVPAVSYAWAENAIVSFKTIPADAAVVVKSGETEVAADKVHGAYDLPAGDYTYTVSKDGYVTKTGSFTITAEQVAGHEKQTIHVSLVSAGSGSGSGSKTVNVNVKVMVPPADQSKRYTYKHDSRSYTNLLTTTGKVTVTAGSSVRDAFVTALDRDKIGYTEQSNGYFPTIGGWSEFNRGEKSGWMYLVNGSMPSVAAQDYELTGNATVVWFYTDDYSNDYGSESWDDDSSSSGTTTTPTTPTTPANPVPDKAMSFTDVKSNDWYYSSVRYAYDNGLFSGVSHDSFGPGDSMDRSMLATVLYSLDGKPAAGKSGFADVADGAWYADAVAWAAEHGIVSGVGGGAFTPGGTITREQLAVMLYRYAQYKGYDVSKTADLSGYADQDKLSDWAAQAVQWACGSGLMNGRSAAQLAPEGTLTRAEAATMLKAFCENVKK